MAKSATIEATAEVFWRALRALTSEEREAVLTRLVRDRQLREDIVDLAIVEQRRNEPSRPLEEYLAERRRRSR